MLWAYQKIRKVQTALYGKNTPRQLAAGLACGLLLGMVPKGNLLALAVASTLLATRMSLATGMLCAFLISLLAPYCDPLTHRIGQSILTNSALFPLWQSISRLPFAAWTSFNNTVVMGNLTLGAILMYPVYRLSLPWMERLQRRYATVERDVASSEATMIEAPQCCTYETNEPDTESPHPVSADAPHIIPRRAHPRERRSCA